jgi:predicted  nucleic acid-binding Zn-ribbon protein
MADAVEKRLRRLEGRLDKLDKNFISLREEINSELRSINKEHAELFDADAASAKKLKEIDKVNAVVSDINSELDSLRAEVDEERVAFSKEITPLFDADNENKKKVRSLEAAGKNTSARIDLARTDTAKAVAKQAAFEKSWNPAVLKKVAETLGMLNKAIVDIERRDSKNMRNLTKLQTGMFAISKHARDIEAEHTDARFAARELAEKAKNLKETVDYFFKNTESLNNKINANAAGLAEITDTLELAKNKILALENQSAQLTDLNEKLEQASRNIDQLIQKVAYLEKATVKTIVLE